MGNGKDIVLHLTEEVSKDLSEIVEYFKFKQRFLNHEEQLEISEEVIIVGAIIEFMKLFKNQKNLSYNHEIKKIKPLANLGNVGTSRPLKNRLKEYMKEHKISQKDICVATGLSKSNISQYINNKNQMTLDTFLKIYVAIGCPPLDEILYREP